MKTYAFLVASSLSLAGALPALASDFGTALEARAMLDRAVNELKAGEVGALAKFNDAAGGYRDRDLYIFCADQDGKLVAHPALPLGTDMRAIKDKNGKAVGEELFIAAKEGQYNLVSYMWPRPSSPYAVSKVSYMTRVGNALCGVGYYK